MASTLDSPVWFDTEATEHPPEHGTVTLDTEHLTFEGSSASADILLSKIKDIRVEHIPRKLGPIPPERVPITVVYNGSDGITAAVAAAKTAVIQPLTIRLLETILTGEPIRTRHPARIGQETTPASSKRGTLKPADNTVYLGTNEDASIDIPNMVSFAHTESSNGPEHLIKITYVRGGQQYRTDIQMTNRQAVSIFGRYLNIQQKRHTPGTGRSPDISRVA